MQFLVQICDAVTGHDLYQSCCLAEQEMADNSLLKGDEYDVFSAPMARQFVGFDSLFDELNALADRKESNYPAYNIAKDDDEHYRIELALAGFSSDEITIQTEKGILTIEANKAEERGNYIHQGIAKRGFSKMFRLAEYMKVDDAQFVDGILTVFLHREVPEADRPKQISINANPKKLIKAA